MDVKEALEAADKEFWDQMHEDMIDTENAAQAVIVAFLERVPESVQTDDGDWVLLVTPTRILAAIREAQS